MLWQEQACRLFFFSVLQTNSTRPFIGLTYRHGKRACPLFPFADRAFQSSNCKESAVDIGKNPLVLQRCLRLFANGPVLPDNFTGAKCRPRGDMPRVDFVAMMVGGPRLRPWPGQKKLGGRNRLSFGEELNMWNLVESEPSCYADGRLFFCCE